MVKKTFKNLISKARERDSYWIGKAISDFTEDLCKLMESRNISKTELARRIGSSPAYVTKVLRGNTNFTVESMVRLVRALDGQLCIRVEQIEVLAAWQESHAAESRGDYITESAEAHIARLKKKSGRR